MLEINKYEYLTPANVELLSRTSNGYIFLKDNHLRFQGANDNASAFTQISNRELIGLTDYDINWLPGGHRAAYFIAIDKEVISGRRVVTNENELVLTANKQGEIMTKIVTVSKRPIRHNGINLGIAIQALDITHSIIPTLFEEHHIPTQKPDKNMFKPRELDCINLLLCGYSYKKIANKLNLSSRTVEYYIEKLRNKLNCPHKQALIDKLLHMGYPKNAIFRNK